MRFRRLYIHLQQNKTLTIMKTINYIHTTAAAMMAMMMTSCGVMLDAMTDPGPSTTTVVVSDGYQTGYDANYNRYRIAYEEARRQALFLSDKMAYELGLTPQQYAAVYEINLDYLLSVDHYDNLFSAAWSQRNHDLFYVLDARQYNRFIDLDYFYRPVSWYDNAYTYSIYTHYTNHNYYYYSRPSIYDTYRGGHNTGNYYNGRFGNRYGEPPTPNWHSTGTVHHSNGTTFGGGRNGAQNSGNQGNVNSGNQSNNRNTGNNSNNTTTIINNNNTTVINNTTNTTNNTTNVNGNGNTLGNGNSRITGNPKATGTARPSTIRPTGQISRQEQPTQTQPTRPATTITKPVTVTRPATNATRPETARPATTTRTETRATRPATTITRPATTTTTPVRNGAANSSRPATTTATPSNSNRTISNTTKVARSATSSQSTTQHTGTTNVIRKK